MVLPRINSLVHDFAKGYLAWFLACGLLPFMVPCFAQVALLGWWFCTGFVWLKVLHTWSNCGSWFCIMSPCMVCVHGYVLGNTVWFKAFHTLFTVLHRITHCGVHGSAQGNSLRFLSFHRLPSIVDSSEQDHLVWFAILYRVTLCCLRFCSLDGNTLWFLVPCTGSANVVHVSWQCHHSCSVFLVKVTLNCLRSCIGSPCAVHDSVQSNP